MIILPISLSRDLRLLLEKRALQTFTFQMSANLSISCIASYRALLVCLIRSGTKVAQSQAQKLAQNASKNWMKQVPHRKCVAPVVQDVEELDTSLAIPNGTQQPWQQKPSFWGLWKALKGRCIATNRRNHLSMI